VATQKSKDILFKKLQKEIEMAIRGSDVQMLGSLDLLDLENCLFKLDYLPLLKESRSQPKKAVNPKNSSNAT